MLNIVSLPTIVDLKPKIALFDKKSEELLVLLDYSELGLMKSVYAKYDHKITFKEAFYLSEKTFRYLSKLGYAEKLDDIGLRIDYNDVEIVLFNNILRKIDINYPIILFEELIGNQPSNKIVLEKIKTKLENKGYEVFQTRSLMSNVEIGNATANLILEFITGHRIQNNKFTTLHVSQFDNIFYYDNNASKILYLKKINELLDLKLQTTKPEIAHNVREYVNNSEIMLSLNAVSSNEVNPISTFNIKVSAMQRYIKNFESFDPNL